VRWKPPFVDPKGFLRKWKESNIAEYERVIDFQRRTAEQMEAQEEAEYDVEGEQQAEAAVIEESVVKATETPNEKEARTS
jgi:hypothetical protein